jgi:hypothetical protein
MVIFVDDEKSSSAPADEEVAAALPTKLRIKYPHELPPPTITTLRCAIFFYVSFFAFALFVFFVSQKSLGTLGGGCAKLQHTRNIQLFRV